MWAQSQGCPDKLPSKSQVTTFTNHSHTWILTSKQGELDWYANRMTVELGAHCGNHSCYKQVIFILQWYLGGTAELQINTESNRAEVCTCVCVYTVPRTL